MAASASTGSAGADIYIYTSTGCEVLVFGGARAEAKCELGTVSQRRHDRFIQQFHAVGSVPQEAPLVPATRSKEQQGNNV